MCQYHASKLLAQLTMPSSSSPGTAWTPGPGDSALIIWEHSGSRLDARAVAFSSVVVFARMPWSIRSMFTRRPIIRHQCFAQYFFKTSMFLFQVLNRTRNLLTENKVQYAKYANLTPVLLNTFIRHQCFCFKF